MSDMMTFPDTVEEFMEMYKMIDTEEVYSNGTEYVPIYRMKQWFEHQRTSNAHPTHECVKPTHEYVDSISRQAAINAIHEDADWLAAQGSDWQAERIERDKSILKSLPSAQPEPLSDAYVKAVWIWLLNYQVEAAELKGKYTPYEVLSWVAHDWRKEHE